MRKTKRVHKTGKRREINKNLSLTSRFILLWPRKNNIYFPCDLNLINRYPLDVHVHACQFQTWCLHCLLLLCCFVVVCFCHTTQTWKKMFPLHGFDENWQLKKGEIYIRKNHSPRSFICEIIIKSVLRLSGLFLRNQTQGCMKSLYITCICSVFQSFKGGLINIEIQQGVKHSSLVISMAWTGSVSYNPDNDIAVWEFIIVFLLFLNMLW